MNINYSRNNICIKIWWLWLQYYPDLRFNMIQVRYVAKNDNFLEQTGKYSSVRDTLENLKAINICHGKPVSQCSIVSRI